MPKSWLRTCWPKKKKKKKKARPMPGRCLWPGYATANGCHCSARSVHNSRTKTAIRLSSYAWCKLHHLVQPSSVPEFNKVCTQLKEKSAVHIPNLQEQALAFSCIVVFMQHKIFKFTWKYTVVLLLCRGLGNYEDCDHGWETGLLNRRIQNCWSRLWLRQLQNIGFVGILYSSRLILF